MINFFTIGSSVANSVKDTFIRANETLSRATDGTLWKSLRGTWTVSSNKLTTTTPTSSYPIAVVDTPTSNVDITIKNISQGTTAALWVTDSLNWWGVGIDQEVNTSCNCSTCNNPVYGGNNAYTYACGTYTYYAFNYYYCCNVIGNRYCKTWSPTYSIGQTPYCTSWNAGNCNEANTTCQGNQYSISNTNYCVGYNAATITGYTTTTCNCVTCFPQYVRLIKSVANTVSTVVSSFISNSFIIKSIKILVRGSTPTVQIYSDTDTVSQIGADLVYNPTGVAVVPRYGIIIKPSNNGQNGIVGEIQISSEGA